MRLVVSGPLLLIVVRYSLAVMCRRGRRSSLFFVRCPPPYVVVGLVEHDSRKAPQPSGLLWMEAILQDFSDTIFCKSSKDHLLTSVFRFFYVGILAF